MTDTALSVRTLRNFGLLVGGIFAAIGLWPLVVRGAPPRASALIAAGLLVLPAIICPRSLAPVYRGWMAVGHVLGWVQTRLVLGLLFYLVVTPVGLIRRRFAADPMRRRLDPAADSYRVASQPRPATHMRRQF
jgi:hypothetical protein